MPISKVTTGSITDSVAIDTDTLVVDGTNNRLGINQAAPAHPFQVGTDDLIVDASGNLLVGKTASNVATVGFEAKSDGAHFMTRDGGEPLKINRKTSGGTILAFAINGNAVGSIGSNVDDLYIGEGTAGLRFDGENAFIYPYSLTAGAPTNGAITLGSTGNNFKDLFLSGGVYLGGVGAANYLDDYEEGTWTPNFNGYASGFFGDYVKIGRQVTCRIKRWGAIPSGSISGNVTVTGLPFTASINVSGNASGQGTSIFHIRAANVGIANAPWGMVTGTSLALHTTANFGSTAVYGGQGATYPATTITQNGSSSVIIDWVFNYFTD